jgi:hypothetical protein
MLRCPLSFLAALALSVCSDCGEIPIDVVEGDRQDAFGVPPARLVHGICVKCWVGEHLFLDDDSFAEKKMHSKRVDACMARMKLKKVRIH